MLPPDDPPGPANAGPSGGPEGPRRRDGRFRPGLSGNPGGRRAGSRPLRVLALDAMAAEAAEDILQGLIERARAGDVQAQTAILSRLWPIPKGRRVKLALPDVRGPGGAIEALAALLDATTAGMISGDEAQSIAGLVERYQAVVEVADLAERIAALEAERRGGTDAAL